MMAMSQLTDMMNHLLRIHKEDSMPKFKNKINHYYLFFGTEVHMFESKLTFAIHIPMLQLQTFEFYHLYFVIQNH